MTKSNKALLLGAVFAISTATPALAQSTAAPTDVTTMPADDDDDEGKWGLLGLLGLAGLLGLKRRDRDDHRQTTTGNSGRL